MTTTPYPCDRSTGMPVGYHVFQVTEYGTCCKFCGAPDLKMQMATFENIGYSISIELDGEQ